MSTVTALPMPPPRLALLAELSQPSSPLWIQHTTRQVTSIFQAYTAVTQLPPPATTSFTSPPSLSRSPTPSCATLPPLIPFVQYLVSVCQITNASLLYATVYTRRLHARLPAGALSKPGAVHRIFVGALLLAHKYVEDAATLTPRKIANTLMRWPALSSAWSRIALGGPATRQALWWAYPAEIARIERAFLKLMDFQLYVSEEDMAEFLPEES
ncbi:hypothetical protein IWQ60_008955 [Tieghemiomyces parasiticus]|uniref:Cyclin N-terminal domain-containing protein n=1 Tax=Tieghemiomyces parasiticus TaxID=78921 RepID=A0A9W8DP34_9FUNG|nr:hypothetical protein IWQ60_009598 [Tieghemiomyces parasiticus]KAJ1914071.1 hypothetical protein IWQ60_008955 [Tieghemiomyces parasiticus]